MTRCFLGFELTDDARAYLQEMLAPIHDRLKGEEGWPVRIVPSDNWHATLLFFPDLSSDERDRVWAAVMEAADEGAWAGLRFSWRGLALWPSTRRPGMICLEAPSEPTSKQHSLRWALTERLDEAPFNKGHTEHLLHYRPHVTLMRLRQGKGAPPPKAIASRWETLRLEFPQIDPEAVQLDRLSFFLSTVSPQQPTYPREHTLKLRG